MSSYFVLKIQYVNRPPETRNISAPTTSIGRESGDIVLNDPQTSGRHAEILFQTGQVRVRDVGSTNGTWFNGQRLMEFVLEPGQWFQAGQTTLQLMAVHGEQPAAPAKTVMAMGAPPPAAGPGGAPGWGPPGGRPPGPPAGPPPGPPMGGPPMGGPPMGGPPMGGPPMGGPPMGGPPMGGPPPGPPGGAPPWGPPPGAPPPAARPPGPPMGGPPMGPPPGPPMGGPPMGGPPMGPPMGAPMGGPPMGPPMGGPPMGPPGGQPPPYGPPGAPPPGPQPPYGPPQGGPPPYGPPGGGPPPPYGPAGGPPPGPPMGGPPMGPPPGPPMGGPPMGGPPMGGPPMGGPPMGGPPMGGPPMGGPPMGPPMGGPPMGGPPMARPGGPPMPMGGPPPGGFGGPPAPMGAPFTPAPMGAPGGGGVRPNFQGTGGELFVTYLVGMLLTSITFGIYMAWFQCKLANFMLSNMTLGPTRRGDLRLEFTGKGGELFVTLLVGNLLLAVTFGIYMSWYVVKLIKFFNNNTTATAQDGTRYRLNFEGTGGELFVTFLVGGLLTSITFGIYFSWFICKLRKVLYQRTSILENEQPVGNLDFEGKGGQLFVTMLVGMLLTGITLGIYRFWFEVKLAKFYAENTRVNYQGRVFAGAFHGTGGEYFVTLLVGGLLCGITLGIYFPWLLIKLWKFDYNNLEFNEIGGGQPGMQAFPPQQPQMMMR